MKSIYCIFEVCSKVIAGLSYRSIGNLHVYVFLTYFETEIVTQLQKTLLCSAQEHAGVIKKFAWLLHWHTFLFLRNLFIQPVLISNFFTKFNFLLNIFRSPSIS